MNDAVVQNNPMPTPKKAAGYTFAPGSKPLPDYTIKRGLGEGGFGEVYFAHSDAGKEVALKVVRRHLDIELRGVSQCLNLKHPNLVALFDVRVDGDGNHWIVMEYVAGERLCDALLRYPRGLPIDEALSWFRGIAGGVEYLHQNGIVHRDLKPANLFRENGVVKIGDYGLSKFISASRRSGHTESVGTVHYMAPEIAGGRYGKEIDVYSLGVLLCEMLTGRVPFDGESVGEILMKHLSSEPDLSGLAEPHRTAIAAALHKDPTQRPALGDFVRHVTGTAPLPARPPAAPAQRAIVPSHPPRRVEPAATMPHPTTPVDSGEKKGFGAGVLITVVIAVLLLTFTFFVSNKTYVVSPNSAGGYETGPVPLSPTWSRLSIGVVAILALVGASLWSMRRMIVGTGRASQASNVATVEAPATFRDFATDLTGSWLLLFVSTAVLSRLMLLLHGDSLRFEQYVWTAASTFTATALLTLAGKWPGEVMHRRAGRRVRNGLIGAAVGGVSWMLFDYLHVGLPSEYRMTQFAGAWPECFIDGKPTWLAFVGYFGAAFFLIDWQFMIDPRRRTVWRASHTAVAVFWACVVYFFFPFPQSWGVLVVAGTAAALPFVFPIAEHVPKGRVAAGKVA